MFVDVGERLSDPGHLSGCEDPDKKKLLLTALNKIHLKETTLSPDGIAYVQFAPNVKVALVQLPRDQLDKLELLEQPDLIIWGGATEDALLPPFQLKPTNPNSPWVFSAGSQGQYLGKLEFFNLNL